MSAILKTLGQDLQIGNDYAGTGGWAHVATALREDLPLASAGPGLPQTLLQPSAPAAAPMTAPSPQPLMRPAAVTAPAEALQGDSTPGHLPAGASQALPMSVMATPAREMSSLSEQIAAQPPVSLALDLPTSNMELALHPANVGLLHQLL